jgi:hypothetical protein
MPSEVKRLYNRKLLTDKEAFKHYRENAKHRDFENTGRSEHHGALVRKFYKKIGEKMIENPHGVFLRNFGYFTILMNPNKTTGVLKRGWLKDKVILNPHTNGRVFHPIFLPICNNSKFKLFIMDKTFSRNIKMKLKNSLRKKVKYLNHYGLLNSMYKNKK